MEKSPDAFRTISEVADWLGVPTHVLRFWESRFPQVKPVKRAGGRRYYRPADMALLGGIKRLLHDDGMTIRGVQKMLREEGVRHVSSYSQPLDAMASFRDVTPGEEAEIAPSPMAVDVEPEPLDNVVPMAAAPAPAEEDAPSAAPADAPLMLGTRVREEATEPEPEPAPAADFAAPLHGTGAMPDLPAPQEDAAPAPGQEPEPEGERLPELSFLRRAAAPPAPEAPQPDLFSSRRAPEPPSGPPPEPPRPRIPTVPQAAESDPADDDAAILAVPGLAARLIAHRVRPDHAAIAAAVADLRALRARL